MTPVSEPPRCHRCVKPVGVIPNPTNFGKWMMAADVGHVDPKMSFNGLQRGDAAWYMRHMKDKTLPYNMKLKQFAQEEITKTNNLLGKRVYFCAECVDDYLNGLFELQIAISEMEDSDG